MNPPSPALILALGVAAIVLIAGIVAFIVLRRRLPKSVEALPPEDLPAAGEPEPLDAERFAPPEPDDLSSAAMREDEPVAMARDDHDDTLVLDPREPIEVALQPASQPADASTGAADVAKVTFRMFLPTQGHARSAGQIARRDGYTADVQPPANGEPMWLCLLTREMTASPAAIGEEMAFLAELAGSFGGRVER